jgi:hypothetical protein
MRVIELLDVTVRIECDCNTVLVFKKFEWEGTCYSCAKKIMISNLVEAYKFDNGIGDKPKLGRPIGSKDSFSRSGKDGDLIYQEESITEEAKNNAVRVIKKFGMNYNLNEIAKTAEKYKRGKTRN